eukprot:scaffold2910_cov390-Prasinococcus_capsulatus_cf.AAC.15
MGRTAVLPRQSISVANRNVSDVSSSYTQVRKEHPCGHLHGPESKHACAGLRHAAVGTGAVGPLRPGGNRGQPAPRRPRGASQVLRRYS